MKKVSVIGLFCNGIDVADGQSIKTRIVADELERALGRDQVARIDTYGWKRHPFKLFSSCISAVHNSSNVIFMTDEGGIKVFPWLLLGANRSGKCVLHYIVIGGWLVHFLDNHPFFAKCLRQFNSVFAETTSMKAGLERLNFKNVALLPNFKNLSPLCEEHLVYNYCEPYRFCTFSRVIREKGIEDAVNAVKSVNEQYGRCVCTLDIYGIVDESEREWFEELSANFTEEIHYRGTVPYQQSVQILKDYFALLFPTFFPKEGIPGTIIDAYSAGLPVIASKWGSFNDIIDDGITGIGYPYLKNELLAEIITDVVHRPGQILEMKKACLKKAECFMPDNVMEILLRKLS